MRKIKLSSKERKEPVTKGYFNDVLESRNYAKNERLDMVIEEVAEIKVKLIELGEENRRHMSALMEDNHHKFRLLIEAFEARFERIERKLFA